VRKRCNRRHWYNGVAGANAHRIVGVRLTYRLGQRFVYWETACGIEEQRDEWTDRGLAQPANACEACLESLREGVA